ncbi:hypothetical protein [Natrarchaeobaculum aegyptiacum]|nr:hypothetical protein [Natrarchaeobaculum aegyptiacum]
MSRNEGGDSRSVNRRRMLRTVATGAAALAGAGAASSSASAQASECSCTSAEESECGPGETCKCAEIPGGPLGSGAHTGPIRRTECVEDTTDDLDIGDIGDTDDCPEPWEATSATDPCFEP